METSTIIKLIVLLVLLILSAFFSSSETALSTVSRVRIRTLKEEGNKKAITLSKVLSNPSKMLSAILIGNNVVNLTASALSTTVAIEIFGNAYVGICTGVLTLLILIFGEILPKTGAMADAERKALRCAPVIRFLMIVLTPVIIVIDAIASVFLKLMGIDKEKKKALTESDIRTLLDVGHEDGAIETDEKKMINNVFDFSDSTAKDIMIPRINMTMVSTNATYRQVLHLFRDSMFTRIPVYEGDDQDHIIGIINVKDFLLLTSPTSFRVTDFVRDVYYTYELKHTSDLMPEMRTKGATVCMVLDEYGATAGMITFEDLLEEIVGEIRDEYDEDEAELIIKKGDKEYLIEGSMKLDDINEALTISLSCEEFDSIGGLLIYTLGRLPKVHDKVKLEDGSSLEATKVWRNHIEKVTLILPDNEEEEKAETSESQLGF